MALATPTISVQDGTVAAATNVNAGATAFVTPGNQVTVALQSSTGVQRCEFVIQAPGALGFDGLRSPILQGSPFSWSFVVPTWYDGSFTIQVEVSDGFNATYNFNNINAAPRAQGFNTHRARFVSAANNESLTAFVGVTGGTARDGVNGVQGDYVLLTGQSTKSQNGLYVIGVVSAGTAPLTRAPDFATGNTLPAGQICEVSEGTLFANSTWKITTTGAITVDTTNHDWFPRQVNQSVTLVAGTATIANVPILSATKTQVTITRTTANTASSTVSYQPIGGLTAGIVGTGTFNAQAAVAAGTINASDVSTVTVGVTNW
jgi:hypothetical protein